MSKLILLQDGQATTFELDGTEKTLGRLPECEIQLPSNMVSRRHARVIPDGTHYRIEDLGSGNGTHINGQKVTEPTLLNHNDRIKFGPMLMRFESDDVKKDDSPSAVLSQIAKMGQVEIQEDDKDSTSTIVNSLDDASGFGMLSVRPQEKLKAILEISRELAGTLDVDALLPKILDSLLKIFPSADRGCILLKDPKTGKLITRAMKHRREG